MYIVLSKTNSSVGKLIRLFTKCQYNHVSLAFNENLQPLYSFARYHVNEPFIGGFVEESWLRYLYGKKDVYIKIYAIPLSGDEYKVIVNRLNFMQKEKSKYQYDMRGIFTKRFQRKNYFTCLSFAEDILQNTELFAGRQAVCSIEALRIKLEPYQIAEKVICKADSDAYTWGNDEFYIKSGKKTILKNHIRCYTPALRIKKLAYGLIKDRAL